jgi:hypothetical protein
MPEFINLATRNNIVLFMLPAYLIHCIQPCDICYSSGVTVTIVHVTTRDTKRGWYKTTSVVLT